MNDSLALGQRIEDAAGEDLFLGVLVGAAQLGVAAERIAESDQFPVLGAVALDDVRVDSEGAADRGNSGYSHRPCLWKRLAAGLITPFPRQSGTAGLPLGSAQRLGFGCSASW